VDTQVSALTYSSQLAHGISLLDSDPQQAKDVLSRAREGLSGDERDFCDVELARAYWHCGEKDEVKAILECVQPQTDEIRFAWGLMRSIAEPQHKRALSFLKAIDHLVDQAEPLDRGKFYCQRGYLHRRLKKRDKAIEDYTAATIWYEQAKDLVRVARMKNNLANIYKDAKRFDDAHESVDAAISGLSGDLLAQAYDTKAGIYLAEQNYVMAEKFSAKSISLLGQDRRELLAESLITMAQALAGLSRFTESSQVLDRATEFARYLNNDDLLITVLQGRIKTVSITESICRERAVLTAKALTHTARGAAAKLNITHAAVNKFLVKHNLK